MRIGELAERTGTTRRALRHYEEHGLLSAARAANSYREYDDAAVNRVRNIRFLIEAGLTVEDVKQFMPCLDGHVPSSTPCPPGIAVVHDRLAVLKARIEELTTVHDRLSAMLDGATERMRWQLVDAP